MKARARQLALTVASALLVVACGPDATARTTMPDVPATASPTPAIEAVATSSTAPQRVPARPPGVLLLDWGPREGWDPGSPGAARGALVPLDAATGAEIEGQAPFDIGQAAFDFTQSPDGRYLAAVAHPTQSSGPELRLFDLERWQEAALPPPGTIGRLEWSPGDAHVLYSLSFARLARLDLESQSSRDGPRVSFHTWSRPLVRRDGRELYALGFRSGGADGAHGIDVVGESFVAILDAETGVLEAEIALPGVLVGQRLDSLLGDSEPTYVQRLPALALAPGGERLYVAHAGENLVTVVDLERREVERTFEPAPRRSAFDQLGGWLLDRFAKRAEAKGGPVFAKQALLSPDGRHLYVTGTADQMCAETPYFPCVANAPAGLQVIDTETLDLLAEFEGIGHVDLSPDGRWLVGSGWWHDYRDEGDYATTAGSGLTVIDASTLEVIAEITPDIAYTQTAVSPDGLHAYAISNGPGFEECMGNQMRTDEPCYVLTVFALPEGEVTATRGLHGFAVLVPLAAVPPR